MLKSRIISLAAVSTILSMGPMGNAIAADGAALFKSKTCWSCHGKDAKKTKVKDYPIIGGQKRSYIVTQITDIRSKARKHGKTATMIPFIKKLTDEQIGLLADYLSQIDRSK